MLGGKTIGFPYWSEDDMCFGAAEQKGLVREHLGSGHAHVLEAEWKYTRGSGLLQGYYSLRPSWLQQEKLTLEVEVSQRETICSWRGSTDSLTTGSSPPPLVSFRLPQAMGEPSWKPESSGQESFSNTKMNHMWILGPSHQTEKGRGVRKAEEGQWGHGTVTAQFLEPRGLPTFMEGQSTSIYGRALSIAWDGNGVINSPDLSRPRGSRAW